MEQRRVCGPIDPVGQRSGKRDIHFHQRQPGQLGIHRRIIAQQFRSGVLPARFAQIRVGGDFQRNAVAEDRVTDRGFNDAIFDTLRLAVGRGVGYGTKPPELVHDQPAGQRELQRVFKLGARHRLGDGQIESVNLRFRHLAHLGVMVRHQFRSGHAIVVNHDHLVAAGVGE